MIFSTPIKFVTFGIIIDDLILPDGQHYPGLLGGGGAQTAWGIAATSGTGDPVGLAASVGRDIEMAALAPLKNAGIHLEGVQMKPYPTPRAWQFIDSEGNRRQVWQTPPVFLPRQLAKNWEMLPEHYRNAHYFHMGIHPEEKNLDFALELKARGKFVSLEAFRPPSESPLPSEQLTYILKACHVFSANRQETIAIIGTDDRAILKDILARWSETVFVMHDGENGATAFSHPTGQFFHIPAVKTTVVEVLGAGNIFCGGLLAGWEEGLENATCHALVAASYGIEQIGLPKMLPDRIDYQRRFAEVKRLAISF